MHSSFSMSICRVVGGLWVRLGKIKCAAIWVGLCGCIAALLILRSVGILSVVLLFVCCRLCRPLRLHLTFSGLAKVAIFTTNVEAENQTLINHKCVCGALNRHFCQTRVMPSAYSHSITILFISFISLSVSVNATMIF